MWGLAVERSSTVQKMWTTRALVILFLAGLTVARPQDDPNKKNPDSENRIGFDIDEYLHPLPSPTPSPSSLPLPGQYPLVNHIGEQCFGRDIWYQRNGDGSCSICACVSRPFRLPSVSCLVCNAFCGGDWPSSGPIPNPSPNPFGPEPYPNPFGPEPWPLPFGPEPYPTPIGPEPYPVPIGPEPYPVPFGPEPYPVPFGPEPYPVPFGPEPYPVPVSPEPYPIPFGPEPYPIPFGPEPYPMPVGPEPYPVPVGPEPNPIPFGPEPYPVPFGPEPYPLPVPLPESLPYPLPSPIADYYCPPPPPPIIIPGPPRPVPVPVPVMVPGKTVYIPVPVPVQSLPEQKQIIIPNHDMVPVDRPVSYPVGIPVPVPNARVPVIYYISPVCRNHAPNVPFQSSENCVVFICKVRYHYVYLEKQRVPNCGLPWNGGQNGKHIILYKSGEGSEDDDSVSGASEPEERYALPSYGGNNLAATILTQSSIGDGGSSPSALANALSGGSGGGYIPSDSLPYSFSGGYLGGPASHSPSGRSAFISALENALSGGYAQNDVLANSGPNGGSSESTQALAQALSESYSSALANAHSGGNNNRYGQTDTLNNSGLSGGSSAQALAQALSGGYPSVSALVNALSGGYNGGHAQIDGLTNAGINGGNSASTQALAQALSGGYPSSILNGGRILTPGSYDGGYSGLYNGNSYSPVNLNGGGGVPNWQGGFPGFPGYQSGHEHTDAAALSFAQPFFNQHGFGLKAAEKDPEK